MCTQMFLWTLLIIGLKLEATKMPFNRQMDKQIVVHPYSRILVRDKRKGALKPEKDRKKLSLLMAKYSKGNLKRLRIVWFPTMWHSGKKQSYGDRERSVVARGSKWVEGERWNMGDGGQGDYSVCYCNGGFVFTHLSKPMKCTVQEWTLWTLVNYNVSELHIFTMWGLPPDSTHSKRQFTLCSCISSATSSTGGIVSRVHSTHFNYPLQYSGLESSMDYYQSMESQRVGHDRVTSTSLRSIQ